MLEYTLCFPTFCLCPCYSLVLYRFEKSIFSILQNSSMMSCFLSTGCNLVPPLDIHKTSHAFPLTIFVLNISILPVLILRLNSELLTTVFYIWSCIPQRASHTLCYKTEVPYELVHKWMTLNSHLKHFLLWIPFECFQKCTPLHLCAFCLPFWTKRLPSKRAWVYKTTGCSSLWHRKQTKQMHDSFTEFIKWSLENENIIYSSFILLRMSL